MKIKEKKEKFLEDVQTLVSLMIERNEKNLERYKERGVDRGQVPRIYLRTEDIPTTIEELKNLKIPLSEGGFYEVVTPLEKLSDIYQKYAKKFSTPLGKFIEESKYEKSILLVHANCKDMKIKDLGKYLVELVENFPDSYLQDQTIAKKIFFILLHDKKDWASLMYTKAKATRGIRIPDPILDHYSFQPTIIIPEDWVKEFEEKNKV